MIHIKKPEEIEILKEGGKRHAFILAELVKLVLPGVSTQAIEDEARRLVEQGGDKGAFLGYTPHGVRRAYPAMVCVSVNDEIVHGIPNIHPKIFEIGDVVTLDLGLTHKGLITDAAVTLIVGEDKIEAMGGIIEEEYKENKKLIEYCKEALYLGIKAARSGNKVSDISRAIQSFAEGHEVNLCEGLSGHGVGYTVHEDPFVPNVVEPGRSATLRPGMVIAIEPMMTFGTSETIAMPDEYTYKTKDGSTAVHFEHTVVITEGEPIILTK